MIAFAGVSTTNVWHPNFGPVQNGFFIAEKVAENVWASPPPFPVAELYLEAGEWWVDCSTPAVGGGATLCFRSFKPQLLPMIWESNLGPFAPFAGGVAVVYANDPMFPDPKFDDDIELAGLGLPTFKSFFEPIPLGSDDTRRYAERRTGTRIYIKRNFEL